MFNRIDHMVIAVSNLEQAVKDYEAKLGLKARDVGKVHTDLGIRNAILPLGQGGQFIELAEPLGPETPLGRTLQRRGEGIHLAAVAVDDLKKAVAELKGRGVQVIEGGRAAFVHPKDTHGVLFELVERK